MSTAFTPGPWFVSLGSDEYGPHEIESRALPLRNAGGDHGRVLVGECRPGDARLIAAAPDLLEIARRLSLATEEGDDLAQSTHWFNARTQRVHCKGSFLDLIEAARAAILKATGERP